MLIGIDLGTTGARAVVYSDGLRPLGQAYKEVPLVASRPGQAEQNAGDWWSLTAQAVRQALLNAGAAPEKVRALAVTSQGISVVPVGEDGNALRPAISWLDERGEEEAGGFVEDFGAEELCTGAGKPRWQPYSLPRILWLQQREAETWKRCRRVLLPQDYLVHRLTGKAVTDHTLAAGTLLYNLERESWWPEVLQGTGIGMDRMPGLVWGGTAVGHLCEGAAAELGLPQSVLVAAGGQDQKCAALAAGLAGDVATISLGTSAAITVLSGEEKPGYPRFPFFTPGQRVLEGVVPTAGMVHRWLKNALGGNLSYDDVESLAAQSVGGHALLFFPSFSGEGSPTWDGRARAHLHGMSLDTTLADICCAAFEGVAIEVARNLNAMGAQSCRSVRLFGGGAQNDFWCQMIADCAGLRIETLASHEMAARGAAILAAKAAGIADVGAPVPTEIARVFEPDEKLREYYAEKMARYEEIRGRLCESGR